MKETSTAKISDYAQVSDSASLTNLDGHAFSITAVEDSDYTETKDGKEVVSPGVKITTRAEYDIEKDGKTTKVNKFHTTRKAIVSKLAKGQKLREDIDSGTVVGPMVCKKVPSVKGGLPYFDLVDYEQGD